MPDITMCKDGACPSRQQCLRFMADPSDNQFYMVSDRSEYEDHCGDYWPWLGGAVLEERE